MDALQGTIESLLFTATKPLSMKTLAKLTGEAEADVHSAIERLAKERNSSSSGIHVLQSDGEVQLVTNPAYAEAVANYLNIELDPELSTPSLEALTIIAYRGPVTRPEIEAIRGVNCSLIVRNLLLRGLITEEDDAVKMQAVYKLSPEALRYFGVHNVAELPDYSELHTNARIDGLLAALQPLKTDAAV